MGSGSTNQPQRNEFRIIHALNADWHHLALIHHGHVASWARTHEALAGCTCPADVLERINDNPDGVLGALLTEKGAGDEFAGRVALQAMLPKIVRMARRQGRAEVDDYVSAMWCRICSYPIQQRPAKIAANLALDTLKTVTQERRWSRLGVQVTSLSTGPSFEHLLADAFARHHLDHNADIAALSAERVIATAGQLGLVDAQTCQVLLTVYAEGLSGRAAAVRHQTSAAMIRFRCSKAVRRLAEHSASLVEAA